jgi:hypothetical protein
MLDKVIVSFENQTNRDDMMKKFISFSKSLNQLDRKFFVSPDLTTQEQKFAKQLRDRKRKLVSELKEEDKMTTKFSIYKNEIWSKDTRDPLAKWILQKE